MFACCLLQIGKSGMLGIATEFIMSGTIDRNLACTVPNVLFRLELSELSCRLFKLYNNIHPCLMSYSD